MVDEKRTHRKKTQKYITKRRDKRKGSSSSSGQVIFSSIVMETNRLIPGGEFVTGVKHTHAKSAAFPIALCCTQKTI